MRIGCNVGMTVAILHDEGYSLVVYDVRPSVDSQVHFPFGISRAENSDALHLGEVVSQIHPLLLE